MLSIKYHGFGTLFSVEIENESNAHRIYRMRYAAFRHPAESGFFCNGTLNGKIEGGVDGVGLVFMTGMVGGESKCGIRFR